MNAYVEIEEKFLAAIRDPKHKDGDDKDAISTRFLYRPAGFGAFSDEQAVWLHDKILLPKLDDRSIIPKEQSMTLLLASSERPIIFKAWKSEGELASDWGSYRPHPAYNCLFEGREDGRYLQIGYPGQFTRLIDYVGPSGAYLFVRSETSAQKMPQCLMYHLRDFVQTLVTARLWAISDKLVQDQKELVEKLQVAVGPFTMFHGHLLSIAKAARDVTELVDNLDKDTSELEYLQSISRPIFETIDRSGKLRQGSSDEGEFAFTATT